MSEHDTDAPLDTPPTNFDHIVYESLDPPKQDDPLPFDTGREGLEQAADEFSHQTKAERNVVTERTWGDPRDWSKHAPGNYQVSAEHASDMLKETREAEARLAQLDADAEIARAIDELRPGDAAQPQQPEFQQTQPQQPELQPQPEAAPAEQTELDRLLAPLPPEQRPHFVAAFNQMVESTRHQAALEYQAAVAHVQGTAQQYEAAVAQTLLAAEASALAPFPELHNIPRDQVQAVVQHIARTDPEKYRRISWHVQTVKELAANQLQAAQTALQQQQAQQQAQAVQQQQQFREYAELHDSRTLVNETPETRKAIESALIEGAEREGIAKQTLVQIWNSNPVARHSYFQNLIADGVKYRLAQRNIPRAAARPVPQVQRPGVSEPASDRSEFAEVSRAYAGKDLSVKDATRLLLAKRASR